MRNKAEDPVGNAYHVFKEIFYPNRAGNGMYFWHFLGLQVAPYQSIEDRPDPNDYYGWVLPPQAQRIVEMLNGPHAETIAKTLVLRGHDPHTRAEHRMPHTLPEYTRIKDMKSDHRA